MKKTLSILLSIITLLSVFILPTSVSAEDDFGEIDVNNAVAISVSSKQYKIDNLVFTKNNNTTKLYIITVKETGVYRLYTKSDETMYINGQLYKSSDLDNYIKAGKKNYTGDYVLSVDITYYMKKGETYFLKIFRNDSSQNDKEFSFIAEKQDDMIAKDGIIYRTKDNGYIAYDNYLSKNIDLSFPETVNGLPVIGTEEYSFAGCKYINSVTFSSKCKIVNSNSFERCYNLKNVKLSDCVENIRDRAFKDTQIKSIYLPKNIKGITALHCMNNLETITVSSDNPNYVVMNNVLFSKDKKTLSAYPEGRTDKIYNIPDGVETIGKYAFRYSSIGKVNFPSSVKNIAYDAFYDSVKLSEVNLNQGIVNIDEYAFYKCVGLSYINLPSSIENIGIYCFDKTSIRNIIIPEKVKSISRTIVDDCYELDTVVFKNSNIEIINTYLPLKFKNIIAESGSTAEQYANKYNINFISSTIPDGKECTNHYFIEDKCVKVPDCMNYGIYTTKCAICGASGKEKKVKATFHIFSNDICSKCGIVEDNTQFLQLNQHSRTAIPMPVKNKVYSEFNIVYTTKNSGNYKLTLDNISDKIILQCVIIGTNKYNRYEQKYIRTSNFDVDFYLEKNEQITFYIKCLDAGNDYTYYEPIRIGYKLTCTHMYKNNVVKPTYTAEGYTIHKCTTCGHRYKNNKKAKLKLNMPTGLSLKSGKKSLIVSYKKVTKATGYQIQYSLNKNFKSAKNIKITKNNITKKTITKLKSNKKYYVRLRSYIIENKKTIYSSFTNCKNVKVK